MVSYIIVVPTLGREGFDFLLENPGEVPQTSLRIPYYLKHWAGRDSIFFSKIPGKSPRLPFESLII